MDSFEGFIHTKIPYMYQIFGYPETIIYVLLFIGILNISIKYAHKKIITILSIIIMLFILFDEYNGFSNGIKYYRTAQLI